MEKYQRVQGSIQIQKVWKYLAPRAAYPQPGRKNHKLKSADISLLPGQNGNDIQEDVVMTECL